jgi:hypothetical protein
VAKLGIRRTTRGTAITATALTVTIAIAETYNVTTALLFSALTVLTVMVGRGYRPTVIVLAPITVINKYGLPIATALALVIAGVMVNMRTIDTPSDCTVMEFLKRQLPWSEALDAVGSRFEAVSVPGLQFDPVVLDYEIRRLYKEVGTVLWRSKPDGSTYGLSLSYNPEHPQEEWKQGNFGHYRYSTMPAFDYYKAVEADVANRVRGDYLDSYGFRHILPQAQRLPHLMSILSRFQVPLIRCSIRTINGYLCVPNINGLSGFHQDDPPCELLRINLCITNDGSFGLQYAGQDVIYPDPGDIYIINSDVDHRVIVSRPVNFQRTHLIIGVAPWFDYDAVNDSWYPNKWFGVKHPYDMAKEGLLFLQG